MRRKRYPPDDPREWLNRARSNLALARAVVPDVLGRLNKNGVKIPRYIEAAEELTRYAVVTRYPDRVGPVSRRTYRRAVRIATAVLRWAERQILGRGKRPQGK